MSGDTQEPLLKELGRQLRDNANITIAFQLTGSCTLSPNLYNGTPHPDEHAAALHPVDGGEPDLDDAQTPRRRARRRRPTPPNLGISALFTSELRGLGAPPAGIGQFNGPIQAYTFIVPTAEFASQTAISADGGVLRVRRRREQPGDAQRRGRVERPDAVLAAPGHEEHARRDGVQHRADAQGDDARHCRRRHHRRPEPRARVRRGAERRRRRRRACRPSASSATRSTTRTAARASTSSRSRRSASSTRSTPTRRPTAFDKQNIRDGHYTPGRPRCTSRRSTARGVPTNPAVKYITDLVLGNPSPTPPDGLRRRRRAHRRPRRHREGRPHAQLRDAGAALGRRQAALAVHAGRAVHLLLPEQGPQAARCPASCTTCTHERRLRRRRHRLLQRLLRDRRRRRPRRRNADRMRRHRYDIINACTNATAVQKTGLVDPDGRRRPAAAQPLVDASPRLPRRARRHRVAGERARRTIPRPRPHDWPAALRTELHARAPSSTRCAPPSSAEDAEGAPGAPRAAGAASPGFVQVDWVVHNQASQNEINGSTGRAAQPGPLHAAPRARARSTPTRASCSGRSRSTRTPTNGPQVRPIEAQVSLRWPEKEDPRVPSMIASARAAAHPVRLRGAGARLGAPLPRARQHAAGALPGRVRPRRALRR